MVDWFKKNYEYFLLLLILIVGAWLRFHQLGETSLSNDELSAITRARYDSFHELVERGIKTDGHPALVEMVIWFIIHHINDDVFTIRFLFAVAGIISILFIYLLAKRWFGITTALLSAATLATLQFPVLYSQLARPYSLGLMFTLATAYFWTRILFDNRRTAWDYIAYILSTAACMYTHYFSFLMAAIIAASGLFFLNKKNYVPYLLSNVIVALLFIPHISITKFQLAYGGLGWLSAPKSNFLSLFIHYGFNDSQFIFYLFALILLISAIVYSRKYKWKKFHTLCVAWFLIPFAIGYYYSTHKVPVLQYSTLLFSFPFILIFLFSFFKESPHPQALSKGEGRKKWLNKTAISLLTLIILACCTYSTIAEKKYYSTNHFGVFKELAQKVSEWNKRFGKENITTTFTLSNPEYIDYYFKRLTPNPSPKERGEENKSIVAIYTNDGRNDFGRFSQLLDTTKTEYFSYAWTNWGHEYETLELIQEKYPLVAERDTFFNSEITLFKKHDRPLAANHTLWSMVNGQKMDAQKEYSDTYRLPTVNLNLKPNEMLKAEVRFNSSNSLGNAALVFSVNKKNETILWKGMPLKYFFIEKDKWARVILCSFIISEPGSELAAYVWNPDKKTFYIDNFKVSVIKKNLLYRP